MPRDVFYEQIFPFNKDDKESAETVPLPIVPMSQDVESASEIQEEESEQHQIASTSNLDDQEVPTTVRRSTQGRRKSPVG